MSQNKRFRKLDLICPGIDFSVNVTVCKYVPDQVTGLYIQRKRFNPYKLPFFDICISLLLEIEMTFIPLRTV